MQGNVSSVEAQQRIQDDIDLDAGCAGVEAGYISNDLETASVESKDSVSVGSSSEGSPSSSKTSVSSKENKSSSVDDPGYVNSRQTEDNSKSSALGDALDELDSLLNDRQSNDYYYKNEDGYYVPKSDEMESFYQEFIGLLSLIRALLMLEKSKENVMVTTHEILTSQRLTTSETDEINESLQIMTEQVNHIISDSYRFCMEKNKAIYEQHMEEADEKNSGFWDGAIDWITGGEKTQDVYEAKIKATAEYENATRELEIGLLAVFNSQSLKDGVKIDFNKEFESAIVKEENGYLSVDMSKLVDLREKLMGRVNYQDAIIGLKSSMLESAKTVQAVMLGIEKRSANTEFVQQSFDMISTHAVETFGRLAQTRISKVQLHNSRNYLDKQLEKAKKAQVWNILSAVFTVAGVVIAGVITFATLGAGTILILAAVSMGCGVASAGLKLGGAVYADKTVHDDYSPTVDLKMQRNVKRVVSENNQRICDMLYDLNKEEQKILDDVSEKIIKQTSDGFKTIDTEAFAMIQERLQDIDNIRQAIIDIGQSKYRVMNTVQQILYNVSTTSNSNFVKKLQSRLGQNTQFKLQSGVFELSEAKNAYNLERQQEIAMQNAVRSFYISSAIAVGGGVLGGALAPVGSFWVFFSVGWGLGQAGGMATAEYYNAKYAEGSSYSTSMKSDKNFLKHLKEDTAGLDEYDRLENEIYLEIYNNGIERTDAGYTLDSGVLVDANQRLARTARLKSVIAEMQKAYLNTANVVTANMYGYTVEGSSLASDRVASDYRNSQIKMNYVVSFQKEKMEVLNRAKEAKDNVKRAGTNLGINLGIAVIGGALAGAGFTWAIFLAAPLMGLSTTAYNFFYFKAKSNASLGKADDIARLTREERKEKSENNLDQLERELYEELGKKLTEEYGFNSGFSGFYSQKMEKIYRAKDVLTKIYLSSQKMAKKAQKKFGAYTGRQNSIAEETQRIGQMEALSLVQSTVSALQAMDSLQGVNSEYRTMMWKSLVSLCISSASFSVSVIQQLKVHEMNKEIKTAKVTGKDLSKNDKYLALNSSYRDLSWVNLSLSLLGSMNGWATSSVIRAVKHKDKAEKSKEIKSADRQEQDDYKALRSRLETSLEKAYLEAGEASMRHKDLLAQVKIRNEAVFMAGNLLQIASSTLQNILSRYNEVPKKVNIDRIKKEEEPKNVTVPEKIAPKPKKKKKIKLAPKQTTTPAELPPTVAGAYVTPLVLNLHTKAQKAKEDQDRALRELSSQRRKITSTSATA